jgi:hypothetical protein
MERAMDNTRMISNEWIERVEHRVKELLAGEGYPAIVMTARGVPPDHGVPAPAVIYITPREPNAWTRDFEIRQAQNENESNLNIEAGRILKEFNVTLQKGEMVSDWDPLDEKGP